ncbi:tail protein X [Oscillospiraceae bacterium 21-37]
MAKTYTTVQGDMWDSIAYKALGSVNLTDRLMMANRRYLHLYTFPAGIVLDVPEIKPESVSEGLPPWKKSRR